MNSFNGFANSIRNIYYVIRNYVYNFPAVDASLVFYYPLDSSNGSINAGTANYASGLPVYDASMMGLAMNAYNPNNFVTGLGDLSLNNTMGSAATAYVKSDTSFNLVPSTGLSISMWVSCSAQDVCGTLISLYQKDIDSSIRIGLYGSKLFSGYYIPPPNKTTINTTSSGTLSGYKYYTVTSSKTIIFTNVSGTIPLNILAVGGGGGSIYGGGGGGGYVEKTYYITANQTLTITIGLGKGPYNAGENTSIASTEINITAYGGGAGGNGMSNGGSGGSGGGQGGSASNYQLYTGGIATQPTSTTGGFGNSGGRQSANGNKGGGGGGAGDVGTTSSGGAGKQTSLPGIPTATYAAGGNAYVDGNTGSNGGPNTGNGGDGNSKSGGSGIVIIAINSIYIN